MKIIVVTAAIIEDQGKYLLTQRKEKSDQGLKWEFPGGKLEFGETPEQCLIREINEELNIIVSVRDLFQVVSHIYGDRQVILICYRCHYVEGKMFPQDCYDYCWVEKKDLLTYDLAPADVQVVQSLVDYSF